MRGYQTLIQEAELLAMPPEAVVEFLRRRAAKSKDEARDDPVDDDLEEALRARDEPLIHVALARYGRHVEVLSALFQAAAPGSPIRLACLSNRGTEHEIFTSFPVGLLGRQPEPMAEWLMTASADELDALFENPTLSDSFLRDLLERGKGWECIDDDRLCRFVSILHRNPRMRTLRDTDWMDGYSDYSHSSVFNAAWKLAETAPTTEPWAASLGWLYDQLEPNAFSIKEPLTLAARWHVDPDNAKENERQANDHKNGYLGNKERVRKGLARLALFKRRTALAELFASEDVAFRAATYAAGDLTADQLRAGYEKDKEIVFNEAIVNEALWRRQPTRQVLHDIAWDVARNDRGSDLLAANRFNAMEQHMRKKHPAWFAEADEGDTRGEELDDQAPATKADLTDLAGHIERQSQGLDALGQGLRALMGRAGWIWWFSLGALVANLRHF